MTYLGSHATKIKLAWERGEQHWPPDVLEHVRIWIPAIYRGKLALVVATEARFMEGYKPVPPGKNRIRIKYRQMVYLVGQTEVFPEQYNISRILMTKVPSE